MQDTQRRVYLFWTVAEGHSTGACGPLRHINGTNSPERVRRFTELRLRYFLGSAFANGSALPTQSRYVPMPSAFRSEVLPNRDRFFRVGCGHVGVGFDIKRMWPDGDKTYRNLPGCAAYRVRFRAERVAVGTRVGVPASDRRGGRSGRR